MTKIIYIHKKCGGTMIFEWGNGFGCMFQCDKCSHFSVLPTPNQILDRPWILKIDLKRNKLRIKNG